MIVAESVKRRSHTRTRRETIKEEKRYKLQFLKREMKNRSRHACRTCFFLLKKASREQSTFSPALQSSAAQGKLLLRQVLLRPSWLTFFPPQLFLLYLHLSPPFDSVWFSYACPIEPISDFYSPLMRLRRSRFSGIIPQSPVVHRLTNVFDEIDEEERAARGGITGYWCLFFLLVKHQSK